MDPSPLSTAHRTNGAATAADDTWALPAVDLIALYRKKALSPVDAAMAALTRIERLNGPLNAYRVVAAEQALTAARQSEGRWLNGAPLSAIDGVPVSIKDLTPTKALSTRKGSHMTRESDRANDDAPVAARLYEAGAVILGKTNTPEFGWQGITESPLTGVSRNPWDPGKTCGGSSGGAAIAAATGMGALHQAGDGAGSIRIPAAFCGVYGLKPTYGRVPRYPHGTGMMNAVTHHGPITRTVADAALMMTVITRPDDRDAHALPYDDRDYLADLTGDLAGIRIGYSADFGYAQVDGDIAAGVADAVGVFADLGATVERCDPGFDSPRAAFETLYSVQFAMLLAALNPTAEQRAEMDPGLLAIAKPGQTCTVEDLSRAWAVREQVCRHMTAFHRRYDLLITPQLPVAAFDTGTGFPAGCTSMFDWLPFTFPFNMTQQPAASVPCGFTTDGLPMALQIVGPRFADALVLRASHAFETVRPFKMPFGIA